jgi:hypothetical protein
MVMIIDPFVYLNAALRAGDFPKFFLNLIILHGDPVDFNSDNFSKVVSMEPSSTKIISYVLPMRFNCF